MDFYDEYNMKTVRMSQFNEKELEFTKSKILPQVKYMKVDNDVMTDSEQLKDAFNMMRENLRETIKLIQENKDYLQKNLSKKIKFKK
jgi:methyl-accepting chemotaxis protein